MIGSYQDDQYLYILLEFLPNGTLFDFCNKNCLNDLEVGYIFKQITKGVKYLHNKKILHRDIKPENILIDEDFNYKLCDFGFAAPMDSKRSTVCGTNEYLSPEIILSEFQDEKIDIWCLGILLYEMTHHRVPFRGKSFAERKTLSNNFSINSRLNQDLRWCIKSCLKKNPEDRPTAEKILSCKFLQGIDLKRRFKDLRKRRVKKKSVIFNDDVEISNNLESDVKFHDIFNGVENEEMKLRKTLDDNLRNSNLKDKNNDNNTLNFNNTDYFDESNSNNVSTKQSLAFTNNNNFNKSAPISAKNSLALYFEKNNNKITKNIQNVPLLPLRNKKHSITVNTNYNPNFTKPKIVYSKSQNIILKKDSNFNINLNKYTNNTFSNWKQKPILLNKNSKKIIYYESQLKNFKKKKNYRSVTPNKWKLYKNSENRFQFSNQVVPKIPNYKPFQKKNFVKEEKKVNFGNGANFDEGRVYRKTVVLDKIGVNLERLNFDDKKIENNVGNLSEDDDDRKVGFLKEVDFKKKKIYKKTVLDKNFVFHDDDCKKVDFGEDVKNGKGKRYRKTEAIPVSNQILVEEDNRDKNRRVNFGNDMDKSQGKRYRKTKAIPVSNQILVEEQQNRKVMFNNDLSKSPGKRYRKTNAIPVSNQILIEEQQNRKVNFNGNTNDERGRKYRKTNFVNYVNNDIVEKKVVFNDNVNKDTFGRKYKKTKVVFPSKELLAEERVLYK